LNEKYGCKIVPNDPTKFGAVIDSEKLDFEKMPRDSMVISRTNAELFLVAIKLLALGKRFQMTNKNLLCELATTIITHSHNKKCPNCDSQLIAKQSKKWHNYFLACPQWGKSCKGYTAKLENIQYKSAADTLLGIIAELAEKSESGNAHDQDHVNDLGIIFSTLLETFTPQVAVKELDKISNSNTGVKLTTCHKAKGLEANTIFMLMNGFYKCHAASVKAKDVRQEQQEVNLQFVAESRARVTLHRVALETD